MGRSIYNQAAVVSVSVSNSATDGTAAVPSYTFASDPDTGVYRVGANSLGFTCGGSNRGTISSAGGLTMTGSVNGSRVYTTTAGTAAAPSLSLSTDGDTGLYFPSANTVSTATNGVLRLTLDTSNFTSTLPLVAPSFNINSGGSISTFATATQSITFTGPWVGATIVGTVEYLKINNFIHLKLPDYHFDKNGIGGSNPTSTALVAAIRPAATRKICVWGICDSIEQDMLLLIDTSGVITMDNPYGTNGADATDFGIFQQTISYSIN